MQHNLYDPASVNQTVPDIKKVSVHDAAAPYDDGQQTRRSMPESCMSNLPPPKRSSNLPPPKRSSEAENPVPLTTPAENVMGNNIFAVAQLEDGTESPELLPLEKELQSSSAQSSSGSSSGNAHDRLSESIEGEERKKRWRENAWGQFFPKEGSPETTKVRTNLLADGKLASSDEKKDREVGEEETPEETGGDAVEEVILEARPIHEIMSSHAYASFSKTSTISSRSPVAISSRSPVVDGRSSGLHSEVSGSRNSYESRESRSSGLLSRRSGRSLGGKSTPTVNSRFPIPRRLPDEDAGTTDAYAFTRVDRAVDILTASRGRTSSFLVEPGASSAAGGGGDDLSASAKFSTVSSNARFSAISSASSCSSASSASSSSASSCSSVIANDLNNNSSTPSASAGYALGLLHSILATRQKQAHMQKLGHAMRKLIISAAVSSAPGLTTTPSTTLGPSLATRRLRSRRKKSLDCGLSTLPANAANANRKNKWGKPDKIEFESAISPEKDMTSAIQHLTNVGDGDDTIRIDTEKHLMVYHRGGDGKSNSHILILEKQ